jgi:hypothetical protein
MAFHIIAYPTAINAYMLPMASPLMTYCIKVKKLKHIPPIPRKDGPGRHRRLTPNGGPDRQYLELLLKILP